MSSIRGEFFKKMMRMQNINPIAHPEMEQKMKRMSQKYSHTKPKKGYTLECLCTKNGTKYQRLRREKVKPSGKLIYYIHGGCYISGLTYNYRDFCAPFCDLINGAEIIMLDYKLSPEYKYPIQLNEALDLWKTITTYAKPENIIVGGDSSGGNLALAMLLKLRDENRELPCGCFFLSPWTDMTASGKSYAMNYQKDVEIGDKKGVFDEATRNKLLDSYLFECIGDADRTSPYVSPAFADYSGFPPMMLFAGGHEMLLDDTLAVYNKAKSAGVNVRLETQPGMFHSYVLYQNHMPESKASYQKLKTFIKELT